MKVLFIIALSLITISSYASTQSMNVEIASEFSKVVESKEIKALQLINHIGRKNNQRFSSDLEKGEAEDAYYGFLARFQNLKEDKETAASLAEMKIYSDRYDLLIKDLQKFLK